MLLIVVFMSFVSNALNLIKNVIPMCKEGGGFRLTKFVSSVPEVLKDLPSEDKKVIESETLNLCQSETALGLLWSVKRILLVCVTCYQRKLNQLDVEFLVLSVRFMTL